jgi:hypothetical protein
LDAPVFLGGVGRVVPSISEWSVFPICPASDERDAQAIARTGFADDAPARRELFLQATDMALKSDGGVPWRPEALGKKLLKWYTGFTLDIQQAQENEIFGWSAGNIGPLRLRLRSDTESMDC